MPPKHFEEWLTFDKGVDKGIFKSVWPTESNGFDPNEQSGYGGCTMAFGINVGYASVDSEYRIYSCVGHFLDGAIAGLPLEAEVNSIRDTRTFATRRVDVYQHRSDQKRNVLSMQLDFQRPEKDTLLTYSAPPHMQYTPPDQAWSEQDMRRHAQQQGINENVLRLVDASMKSRKRYFELKCPPESYAADTMHGLFPKLGQVQKHKSITEKTACYYWRCLGKLSTPAANAASLGYLLDAGMPVIGPAYAGLNIAKLGTAVSLDFAMRVFVNDVDASRWLTREEKTMTGGDGRTFSEARVWDADGRMVATMSQQCLLRPAKKDSNI